MQNQSENVAFLAGWILQLFAYGTTVKNELRNSEE